MLSYKYMPIWNCYIDVRLFSSSSKTNSISGQENIQLICCILSHSGMINCSTIFSLGCSDHKSSCVVRNFELQTGENMMSDIIDNTTKVLSLQLMFINHTDVFHGYLLALSMELDR